MQSHNHGPIAVHSDHTIGDPGFLTEVEVAGILRCSPRTLEHNRRVGRGPAYTKVGRLVRYTLADVQAWLAARSVAADTKRTPDA